MERSKKKILEEIEKSKAFNEGDIKRNKVELQFLALKIDTLNEFKEENLSVDFSKNPYTLYFDNEENSLELIHPEATSGRYTNYELANYGIIEEKDIKTHQISKEDINSALIAEIMKNIKKVKEDISSLIKSNGDNDIILEKDWDKLNKTYNENFIKLNHVIEKEKKQDKVYKKRIEEYEKC